MKRTIFFAALAVIALSIPAWGQIITVTSPTTGDVWCKGSEYAITWTSSEVSGPLSIKLRPADSPTADPVMDIVASIDNTGSFTWPIPASLGAGTYEIRVRTISNDPLVYGDSANLVITDCAAAGTINVTSPNATSVWGRGTTHAITWTSSGVAGPLSIKLRPADQPTADPILDIIASTDNDGTHNWPIPADLAPGVYEVRVRTVSNDPLVYGDSANFSVSLTIVGTYVEVGGADLPDLELRGISYSPNNGGQIVGTVFNHGSERFNQDVGFAFTMIGVRGGLAPVTRRVDLNGHQLRNIELHSFSPASMPLAGMQFRVNLDWQNLIRESNEDNNVQETRLAYLDIRCTAPNGLQLAKMYLHGGEDFRVKFNVKVRHNMPVSVRNVRLHWDLVRVSSGEVLRGYDHTIETIAADAEYTWAVNETYGKTGRDRSKRPRLSEGATYRVNVSIVDPTDALCDVNPHNDSPSFTFSFPD